MEKHFLLCSDFPFFILIPSGRIRSAVRIKSRMVMGSTPSVLAFLVSRRTRFGLSTSCNSAESSIVIIRSSLGIYWDSAFKKVVFPEPVPPETKILYPDSTNSLKKPAASSDTEPIAIKFSIKMGFSGNLRMEIAEPSMETGSNTILTLEPSGSLVSTIGDASFTIRLLFPAICCITSLSFSFEEKWLFDSNSRPSFS